MVSLLEITDSQKRKLAEKIRRGISIMLKNKIAFKDVEGILKDLEKVENEIKDKKAFFKIFFENGEIRGFYYIRVNDSEKFLAPYFETEFFYSESPKSFFKCLNFASKDLKNLKNLYPHVKSYVGYYTVDENGKAMSHAKIANKRIKEVLGKNMDFKEVFMTFAGKFES